MIFDDKAIKRFFDKVKISNGCWEWKGGFRNKYGCFWFNNKTNYAHRISFMIHNGKIPDNKIIMHKCDNPRCVNPSHLFIGDTEDNVDDRVSKKRSAYGKRNGVYTHPEKVKRGSESNLSKLSWGDVKAIRNYRKNKKYTYKKIASIFNVAPECIGSIIRGESWTKI